MTFDSQIKILNPFDSDQQTLKNSLDKVQTAEQDGTILHNAVEQIAQKSFANVEGRKVIVLLSDGKDFGSSITKNQLLNQLEESDVLIYTILYKTGEGFNNLIISPEGFVKEVTEKKEPLKKAPKRKKGYSVWIPAAAGVSTDEEVEVRQRKADIAAVNILREMSDTTAGRFYLSDTPQLKEIFKKVAGELRQQYRLGYHSKDQQMPRRFTISLLKLILLKDEEFVNGNVKGREVHIKIPDGRVMERESEIKTKYRVERMRMFFHGKRFYLLVAVLPEDKINTPEIDNYLNSFVAK